MGNIKLLYNFTKMSLKSFIIAICLIQSIKNLSNWPLNSNAITIALVDKLNQSRKNLSCLSLSPLIRIKKRKRKHKQAPDRLMSHNPWHLKKRKILRITYIVWQNNTWKEWKISCLMGMLISLNLTLSKFHRKN